MKKYLVIIYLLVSVSVFSQNLNNVPAYMLAHVIVMTENPTFINSIIYPASSDLTKEELMLIKNHNQMFPVEKKVDITYKEDNLKCQKISNYYYDIKATKKGFLTKVEDLFSVTTKNHDTARLLGNKAGALHVMCIDEIAGSCGSKRIKEFNFKGCKAISLKMELEYLVHRYEHVNDSNQLKELPSPAKERKERKGSTVIPL